MCVSFHNWEVNLAWDMIFIIFGGNYGSVGTHKRILVVSLPCDEIKGLHPLNLVR